MKQLTDYAIILLPFTAFVIWGVWTIIDNRKSMKGYDEEKETLKSKKKDYDDFIRSNYIRHHNHG